MEGELAGIPRDKLISSDHAAVCIKAVAGAQHIRVVFLGDTLDPGLVRNCRWAYF